MVQQRKYFVKNFENFRGLDLGKSFLSREPGFAFECANIELDTQSSLQEIQGFKIAASSLKEPRYYSVGKYLGEIGPRFGLKRYVYQDSTTGETKEELIGIGNGLWKLATGTMSVTGPVFSSIHITHSASVTRVMLSNGTGEFSSTTWSGEGASYSAGNRLTDLAAYINSNYGGAGWTVTLTPRAVVNGNQAGKAITNSVTVSSGHTMSVSGRTTPLRVPLHCYYPATTNPIVMWVDVLTTTATTLTVSAFNVTSRLETTYNTTFDVVTGQEFGVGLLPINHLPALPDTSCSTTLNIPFYYWEQVYIPAYSGTLLLASAHQWDDEKSRTWYPQQQNFVAVNQSNCLYVGSPISLWKDSNNNNIDTGLVKYDGTTCYLAGLPTPAKPTLSVAAGAGMDDGVYKYIVQYKHVDARGNYVYSNESLFNGEASITCSNGAANNQVTITYQTGYVTAAGRPVLKYGQAQCSGAQTLSTGSASRTLTVNAGHNVRVADIVGFRDTTSGDYRRKKVTAVTATTIVLEYLTTDPTDTLSNGMNVCSHHSIEIYRTKANGQTYYLLVEIQVLLNTATQTFVDARLDSTLVYEWDEPHTGDRRRDMPPPGPLVESHQGKLVIGGWSQEPNTISWSGLESSEYFPRSTNSTDLASMADGPVTAMASAGADSLICWKERSLLTVVGDMYSGAVFMATAQEGDVGCPSANGWCRARDMIVWCSPVGLKRWKDGLVDSFDDRIRARFPTTVPIQQKDATWDSLGLLARRAVMFNDPYAQRVICFVPYEISAPISPEWKPTTSSRFFVWDYRNDFIAEWSDNLSNSPILNASGGIEYFANELFFLGVVKLNYQDYLMSYLYVQRSTGTMYGDPVLAPQWEFLEEPSFPKDFLSLKFWKLNDPDNLCQWLSASAYDDFDTLTSDSMQFNFPLYKVWSELPIAKRTRASIAFRISSGGKYPFRLTGIELVVATPFRKERTDLEP